MVYIGHDTAILAAFSGERAGPTSARRQSISQRLSLRSAAKSGIVAPLDAPFSHS